jgi:DNA-binding LacI/PurR family transcriptional regulator
MTRPTKRSTSKDVADAAGVSRATVSFVLNNTPGQSIPEETRRRVLEAAERLAYRPHGSARALISGRSDIVLLSIPTLPVQENIGRFIEELTDALAVHGLTLVTYLGGAKSRSLPDVCATTSATVVLGLEPFAPATVKALHEAGAVAVLPRHTGDGAVMRLIGRLQARHLISRGHRRLGYALPAHSAFGETAGQRLQGVIEACVAADVPPPSTVETPLDVDGAARVVERWAQEGVTGVCAFNDEIALAVLAGMREHGLAAPSGLAVIGADDIPAARLATPPLTTVGVDLAGVGRAFADLVAATLEGAERPPEVFSDTMRLIERAST